MFTVVYSSSCHEIGTLGTANVCGRL